MDQCPEKLGNATPPILLYTAYVAGVPLCPRLPHHTLPEGFFLQVFLSVLWRFAVILLLALITMVLVVVIVGYLYNNDGIYDVLSGILIVLGVATLLTAVILFVTHRINKYTYHHNNKEMHPH